MNIDQDIERIKKELEQENQEMVKIALFGQPGAGKSSLINAIVGMEITEVSSKTDATTKAQVVEHEGLLFVDLPGYGTSQFPANKWITEFNPEQYDLFLCVFEGKMHDDDTKFFANLSRDRVCIFVRSKSDTIWEKGKSADAIKNSIREDAAKQTNNQNIEVHFISCRTGEGIPELEDAIINALGPAKRDRFTRSYKARTQEHLEEKRKICERLIGRYAAISAANAINPIPGTDIAIDLVLLTQLFSEIRKAYNLYDDKQIELYLSLPLTQKVLNRATREGILRLLQQFAKSKVGSATMKYIPVVGQAIAAFVGFAITSAAGQCYLDECHELATYIMQQEMDKENSIG